MSTFFAGPRRSTLLLLVLGVMSSLLFALYNQTHMALAQKDAEPAPVSVTGVARQGDDLVVSLRWEARTAPSNAWLEVSDKAGGIIITDFPPGLLAALAG